MSLLDALIEALTGRGEARRLAAESRGGSQAVENHGHLAAGSRRVRPVTDTQGFTWRPARCAACGLLTLTGKELRLHRTRDGQCINPATTLTPRGGIILRVLTVLDDGRLIWAWPPSTRILNITAEQYVTDARRAASRAPITSAHDPVHLARPARVSLPGLVIGGEDEPWHIRSRH